MMNKICLFIGFFACFCANAQVGVGTTSPNAQLDIVASNPLAPTSKDGLLIPRISAFPLTSPSAYQDGMMVYLTAISGANQPGFYYWNNTASTWVSLSSFKGWETSGNANAVSGTNFIGTTNAQDVDFRANNSIKMRLSQRGQLELLNTGNSVFIGEQAGENDDETLNRNAFVGYQAGFSNVDGANNIALGYQALYANTNGYANLAAGSSALHNNTTGNSNVALGHTAMASNLTGVSNVAVGINALNASTAADWNTAVGVNALRVNQSDGNSAFGGNALMGNTTGTNNTGTGLNVLMTNTAGSANTAIGSASLHDNDTGNANTAMGASALYYNKTGSNNTAVGTTALINNQTGSHNAAIGFGALRWNVSGDNNTAIGRLSLGSNTTGVGNAAIGNSALLANADGNFNTGIGFNANVSGTSLSNATAVGYSAVVNASSKIRFGNAAVTMIEGQVPYSNPSDARFKFDVKQNVPGLEFIMKLKPVTYHFDSRKFQQHLMQSLPDSLKTNLDSHEFDKATNIIRTGFLAQDIEKAAREINYDFDGLHTPDASNPSDNYSVAYSQFIMPLVKSVQEQQAEIERLKAENATLKAASVAQKQALDNIEARLSALERSKGQLK